ncbi:MAG: ABC-F family ATP-binding cassette domain-containing protein [Syntrophobacteraceae bacterium]
MVTVQGVSKFLGKRQLFDGASFHVNPGEKIGLIGPNGAGKTTLFNILLGETEPDSGIVTRAKTIRMGYLPQQWSPLEGKTILEHTVDIDQEVQGLRAELEALQQSLFDENDPERMQEAALRQAHLMERLEQLGGYDLEARACKILMGLGFRNDMPDRLVSTLSGGWVMRLELARLLLAEPDLLLLDEPTNHLDLESLLWLEQYLMNTSSALLLIAHDRAFLNRVVTRILELEQGQLHEYTGNYDAYLEEKAGRQEIRFASFKNQQERLRQIERFIERNRYQKNKARQVQSRIKALDKVERIEAPTEQQAEINFTFPEPQRSGKRVIELKQAYKAYGEHVVYSGADLVIERGDRIAFLGPNGAGKSTLLKMLAGVESMSKGERILGHQVSTGYYAQYQWEQLRPECTVLEEASSIAGNITQTQLRSLLGAFLFRGEDVLKRVSVLSGGEKARLILCKLLLQRPNLLLLDEPTNHLDISSRAVLETALEDFPGTICFISHDRHFINTIANKILVVDSGTIHLFPGNFEDYNEIWKKRIEETSCEPGAEDLRQGKEAISLSRSLQEQKRFEAERRNELYRLKKPVQKRIERIEAALESAHKQLELLNARLADPDTYRNGKDVQDLQKEHQQCRATIHKLTSEWEESALALEELEEGFLKGKIKACGGCPQ